MAHRAGRIYLFAGAQILSVLLILAALEFGVRVFLEPITLASFGPRSLQSDPSQAPVFEQHPFAAFTWIPHAAFGAQTVNSQGFVSTEEFAFEKQPGELRIVALGGSSTVGNGNVDENTYPRVLARILRERYPNRPITVINAAAGGYSTIESLGYLQARMIHYRPDVLVVMHAWNDMYYVGLSSEEISRWRRNFNEQALTNPDAPREIEDALPADVRYLGWSQLFLHVREWSRKRAAAKHPQPTIERQFENAVVMPDGSLQITPRVVNPHGLAVYESNLSQIANLCKTWSIVCIAVLQPSMFIEDADLEEPVFKQVRVTGLLYHGFDYEQHVELFREMHARVQRVFAEPFIVDARSMSGRIEYFNDHIHLSAEGTKRLAELVASRIDDGSSLSFPEPLEAPASGAAAGQAASAR